MRNTATKTALVIALGIGFVGGFASSHFTTETSAEVRKSTQRLPVPSGAQQSHTVLQQIAGTLRSIDARLGRIETAVNRISEQPEKK